MCGNWRILRKYVSKILAVKQWEELSLPEEEIIPSEFDRDMKTYRMRCSRLRSNDCFVSLRLHDFRSTGEVRHSQDSTKPRGSDTMKRIEREERKKSRLVAA